MFTGSTVNKKTINGETYSFSPNGKVSRMWLKRCLESIPEGKTWRDGKFPQLTDRVVRGGGNGFDWTYSDGSIDHEPI